MFYGSARPLAIYALHADYGGPVGFAWLGHPERIEASSFRTPVAHNEGMGANWKPRELLGRRSGPESTLRHEPPVVARRGRAMSGAIPTWAL